MFSFQHLPSNPRISLKCVSSFTLFLRASLSRSSILCFTSVLYTPSFPMGSSTSSRSPKPFHTFSTTSSHLVPALALLLFSPIQLCQLCMAGNLFFGIPGIPYFIFHFNFLMSSRWGAHVVLGPFLAASVSGSLARVTPPSLSGLKLSCWLYV